MGEALKKKKEKKKARASQNIYLPHSTLCTLDNFLYLVIISIPLPRWKLSLGSKSNYRDLLTRQQDICRDLQAGSLYSKFHIS